MQAVRCIIVCTAALVFAARATAANAADFYRDKTLTLIVGFAPGGGVDTTAKAADPEFQAEATKVGEPVGAPIGGDALQDMVADLAKAATPDIVAAYRQLGAAK